MSLPDRSPSLPPDVLPPAQTPASQWRPIAYFILSLALIVLGVWILWDFLPALAWAAVLAIATWPLFERFVAPNMHRNLAATAFTLLIALLFIVPLIVVTVDVGREAVSAVQAVRSLEEQGIAAPEWVSRIPWVGGSAATWWQSHLSDPGYATNLLGHIDRSVAFEWTRSVGSQVLHRLALFVFTLLTLFFLFRDGPLLVRQSFAVLHRLFGSAGPRLAQHMAIAVRAAVNGLVLVGLGEGALLAVAYALAGVPHPVLLGALTAILSMLPLGAPLVFGLGAVFLFAQSQAVTAVSLLVFGFLVVFLADHVVRPYFIGSGVRLPFLWVLLGILGGLQAFGLLGLFLGPAVMAALVEMWREWAGADETPGMSG